MSRQGRWLLLAVALGLAARIVRYAVHFPIFGDEAFVAVNFFGRSFRGLLQPLEHEMVASPGWLWATLATSRSLGFGEFALRLPAFLCGIAALLAFVPLATRTLPRTSALCAVALLAASYYPIRHGAEVKPYATDLLVGLPLYGLGLALLREPGKRSTWLLFGAAATLSVWCSWTAIFVVGGVLLATGATVVRERGARLLAPWLLCGVAAAASFAAVYFVAGRHQQWSEATIEDSRQWNEHFPPLAQPWLLPWWLLKEHTGNLFCYPNGGRDMGCVVTTLLVACGAAALTRKRRGRVALLLLSPLVPMLVAAALRRYPYGGSARTTLHFAVPVCLLAGHGFVALARRGLRGRDATALAGARRAAKASRGFVVVMLVFAGGTIAGDLGRPWKGNADVRTRDAIAALRAQSRPGDHWILFGSFHDQAHAPNLLSWRGSSARLEYHLLKESTELGAVVRFAPTAAEAVALAREPATRTWLLAYHDNEAPFPDELWSVWRGAIERELGPPAATSSIEIGPASPDPGSGAPRIEELVQLRFETAAPR